MTHLKTTHDVDDDFDDDGGGGGDNFRLHLESKQICVHGFYNISPKKTDFKRCLFKQWFINNNLCTILAAPIINVMNACSHYTKAREKSIIC